MLTTREKFYSKNILQYLNRNASILICGAGPDDKKTFENAGFTNVTLSNISDGMNTYDWSPYKFTSENAESLSFPNNSFDYVVIHEAIHHASSPHKVITEMYRVAKKGLLAIEARDSLVMRLMVKLNFTQDYEYSGVYHNNFSGGVNNTEIPNFIFRWTEREIEKTICSYAPYAKHTFHYNHATRFPFLVKYQKNGAIKYYTLKVIQPFYYIFTKLFQKQQNLFAFYIQKPNLTTDLFPWIKYNKNEERLVFNKEWGDSQFKK